VAAFRWIAVLCALPGVASAADVVAIHVDPPTVNLTGPDARFSLLISGRLNNGRTIDLTRSARIATESAVVRLTGNTLRAAGDGEGRVIVEAAGRTVVVPVRVTGFQVRREYHFENDLEPLFGRYGCNSAGCHGKAEGQNGFKLSVFGSDPTADYAALVKEGRGRRVLAAAPEQSLFLRKAAGQVPHGGGTRLPVGSDGYETVRRWIADGTPVGRENAPTVARVRVEPAERLMDMRAGQQLRVIATYTDGRTVDATAEARFQTNNEGVAGVSADGLVTTTDVPGEAAIMASFANEVAVFRAFVPRPEAVEFPKLQQVNFIDRLVDAKLRKLNVVPSGPATDEEFLRRASLDIAGQLPTAAEVRTFLRDRDPKKRERIVEAFLAKDGYADLWALMWADVLRVDRQALGPQRAYAYYRWIRTAVAENRPFDQFARELVTADGPLDEVPAAAFYKVVPKPGEAANTLSQVFLGVRIACAECHHHPADRWTQADYAGMAAFFTPVAVRKIGAVEAVAAQGEATAKHPRTGATVPATALGATPTSGVDQRANLAKWMTAPENPYFARNVVNRVWAHFLGRGLVEPVDDVRSTNPPSNPELLDALAKSFVESKYDVKALVRLICASRVYQTTSAPNPTNAKDEQNYSRALFKRPAAEVLLDMVTHVTGVPEKFDGFPVGTRAVQLWDSKVGHYFLKAFGRPSRTSACECERVGEPTIAQVLHLLNSETIDARLRHDGGNLARWLRTIPSNEKLLEELWLTALGRYPTPAEVKKANEYLSTKGRSRREGMEDLAWAILNTKEFLFNH
jgi:hypothetical protein